MTDTTAPARKTYVLDTSVLLAAGKQALYAFAEHAVVLPLVVITELEGKRNDPEIGYVARQVLRELEELRLFAEHGGASLKTGIGINEHGGTVRIELNHIDQSGLPDALRRESTHDARILAVAHGLKRDAIARAAELLADEGVDGPAAEVVLVSRDLPMRLMAGGALGLAAEDYRNDQAPGDGYSGVETLDADRETLDALHAGGDAVAIGIDAPRNTGLVLRNGSQSALAVLGGDGHARIVKSGDAFGLKPRSAEQRIAMSHLLDQDVRIVSMGGKAGTGKTSLALAAGLEQVMERRLFKKVTVFRPMYSVGGQDLGFLPGTEDEKMSPWRAAVYDALESFCSRDILDEIADRGMLEILPLTHIRGRTLHDTFVIVDEAQQLERMVLLSVLSRLGKDSKAVLCHDVAQRDNLRVGRHDGVATVIEKLKGEPLFAHITLTRSERSPVAEMVTRLLDGE